MSEALTRRRFVAGAAAIAGAPAFVPASALGKDGRPAPSERVALACIGIGGRGGGNAGALARDERVEIVGVCEVDRHRLNAAAGVYKLSGERSVTGDHRVLLDRDDIDAVMIATPDHWHAQIAVEAANAGKDLFCEKPISLTVREGRAIVDAVKKNDRVFQAGTWRRSRAGCRLACELVRNGRLGKVHTVEVGIPRGHQIRGGEYTGLEKPIDVPEHLDYDRWLGPRPLAPYHPGRVHFNFRWILDYSAGYITDWGAHYLDIAQWGIDADATGPVRVTGKCVSKPAGYYDAPIESRIDYEYANGVKVVMSTTDDRKQYGIRFVGDAGSAFVENLSVFTDPPELRRATIGEDEVHLYESTDHFRNFIDAVLTRGQTAAPVEAAHRTATACHLGLIACLTERPIRWDPAKEQVIDDPAASAMLDRPRRGPWQMPG